MNTNQQTNKKRASTSHPQGKQAKQSTSGLSAEDFCRIGEEMLGWSGKASDTFQFHHWWTAAFLIDPVVVAEVWK